MKKKNMIKLCRNISKIKYAMVDRWSIIDDHDLLKGLIEDITDIQEKDIDNMVETVLYLIENEDCFVKEIENEIIKRVKEILTISDNGFVKYEQILNILESCYIIESKIAYYPDLEKNLSQEDGKMESYLVIPITSNLQKHLFIEFNVLDYEKSVHSLSVLNSEIKITNIYID